MKVGTSAVAQQQAAKTNKRPQLALDAAFKHTRSGIQVYVERPGHGDKTKDGSHIKVHYEGWLAEDYKMFKKGQRYPVFSINIFYLKLIMGQFIFSASSFKNSSGSTATG